MNHITSPTTHADRTDGDGAIDRTDPHGGLQIGVVLGVAGSALMFAGSVLRPFGTSPEDATRFLDVIVGAPTRWALAHGCYFFGGAMLTAAVVLLAVWLAERSAPASLVAGVLGGVGGAAICGWSAVQLCYLQMTQLEPRALGIVAVEGTYESGALDATVNLPGLGFTLAAVILATVARRARIIGRGALIGVVLGALLTFEGILGIIGWPLLAATMIITLPGFRSTGPRPGRSEAVSPG